MSVRGHLPFTLVTQEFNLGKLEAPALTGFMTYAGTRDGQRFLVPTAVQDLAPAPLTVIPNWPAGLKR